MKPKLIFPIIFLQTLAVSALAQEDKPTISIRSQDDVAVTDGTVATSPPTESATAKEDTLDACRDSIDNDADQKVDCDDEDCAIYAICVKPPEQQAPQPVKEVVPIWNPEYGLMCRDGKDNNNDGLIDCHETSCQRYRYCKRLMYEVPEPKNKAPALLVNFGFGVALPNFRTPTATTEQAKFTTAPSYPDGSSSLKVPFDPDVGGMGSFKIGYLPLKWLGVGLNLMGALTSATNHREHLETDDDPSKYKYQGYKRSVHIGGFVRFQWPFGRFVPYLDVAPGYSYAKYKWQIYDPVYSWDEIDFWDGDEDYYDEPSLPHVTETQEYRHFTLALEPGFDVFVSKRRFAIGFKAWLPIIAADGKSSTEQSSTDNIGLMVSLTFTPLWRERPQLKPEYDVAMIQR